MKYIILLTTDTGAELYVEANDGLYLPGYTQVRENAHTFKTQSAALRLMSLWVNEHLEVSEGDTIEIIPIQK